MLARFIKRRRWTWSHRLTAALFTALLLFAVSVQPSWLQGAPTAVRWFQVLPIVDPLATVEVILAAGSITGTVALGAGLTVLLAMLMGRVFCGWLCPLGLVLELNGAIRFWLQRRLRNTKIRLPEIRLPTGWKDGVLLFFVCVAAVSSLPLFTIVSPINLTILAAVVSPLAGLIVIGGIALLEYAAPRVFCRSLCPLGALYSLLGHVSPWRVHIREEGEQMSCGMCTLRCPMGIDVMQDYVLAGKSTIDDGDCTRCGTCTDACAGNVLQLGFRESSAAGKCPAPE